MKKQAATAYANKTKARFGNYDTSYKPIFVEKDSQEIKKPYS